MLLLCFLNFLEKSLVWLKQKGDKSWSCKKISNLLALSMCSFKQINLITVFPHIVSGNYSFLNLESQRSHHIRLKVTVHKGAETIQGRKLFKGGNYMRKYGILILVHTTWHTEMLHVFLFEPKPFLLTWEIKYAIGFNR